MGRLLPTTPDVSIDRSGDPRLLCIDDDRTGEVLGTLSSDSSRAVFRAVTEEPMTATDVADELEMSIQSVGYHLDNLESAGIIEVLDTCYSEKGHEMKIYGPPQEPLLVFLGRADDRPGLTAAFKRLAGTIGPVAIPLAIGQAAARVFGSEE